MFCLNCNTLIPSEKILKCPKCGIPVLREVKYQPIHYLSLTLCFVAFTIAYFVIDITRQEVIIWDFITVFLSIMAFAAAIFKIPNSKKLIKIVSVIFSAYLLLITIHWLIEYSRF